MNVGTVLLCMESGNIANGVYLLKKEKRTREAGESRNNQVGVSSGLWINWNLFRFIK